MDIQLSQHHLLRRLFFPHHPPKFVNVGDHGVKAYFSPLSLLRGLSSGQLQAVHITVASHEEDS